MLRVTTRGRYALRAMLDLALNRCEGPVPRHEIAERQDLSSHYVAHLFRQLREAGLVASVKGPSGGYVLARDPGSIRISEIVRAVEGPIALADCVLPIQDDLCQRLDRCAAHRLWMRLSETMVAFLDAISLADLCKEARELEPEAGGCRD